jgi:hypothetical protein
LESQVYPRVSRAFGGEFFPSRATLGHWQAEKLLGERFDFLSQPFIFLRNE